MKPTKNITVLLAEESTVENEGLSKLLGSASDIEVIGDANTGRKAVNLTRKFHPDVVIVDIEMPQMNGLEAARQIFQVSPETKVLLIFSDSDKAYVKKVMDVGAVGYLLKQDVSKNLVKAVREVHNGRTFSGSPSAKKTIKVAKKTVKKKPSNNTGKKH